MELRQVSGGGSSAVAGVVSDRDRRETVLGADRVPSDPDRADAIRSRATLQQGVAWAVGCIVDALDSSWRVPLWGGINRIP